MAQRSIFDKFIEEYVIEEEEEEAIDGTDPVHQSKDGTERQGSTETYESEENPLTWRNAALQYLVNWRVEMDGDFRTSKTGKKVNLWAKISSELKDKGHNYTTKQCNHKFRTLKTHYTKVHDKSNLSGTGKIAWPHYSLMERAMREMGRKQNISPPLELIIETQFGADTSISNQIHSTIADETENPSTSGIISLKRFKSGSMIKEKQPSWLKELLSAMEAQSTELLKRLDKSDENSRQMLEIQNSLLKKLDHSNFIEEQKLEFFKKVFGKD